MTDYSTRITALEDAIGSGELTVESDGERVTYRSMADLMRARDYFVRQQATANPRQRPASTLAVFDPN